MTSLESTTQVPLSLRLPFRLLKDVQPEQLVEAIRVVASGEALLAPSITRRLLDRFASLDTSERGAPPELDSLTPRELEILRLIAAGLSNAEIGRVLRISESNVGTRLHRTVDKLRRACDDLA